MTEVSHIPTIIAKRIPQVAISPTGMGQNSKYKGESWYPRPDLNRHASRQWILNPSCLPFHHSGPVLRYDVVAAIEGVGRLAKDATLVN